MLLRRTRGYDNASRLNEVSTQSKQVADVSSTPCHDGIKVIRGLAHYGFKPLGNYPDVPK